MMPGVRTIVTIEIPVEHRFVVGDLVARQEIPVGDEIPPEEQKSVWRIVELGCSAPHHRAGDYAIWDGPWYRMQPINEFAMLIAMQAHGRVSKAATSLIDLMRPVTERIGTVDRTCEPHDH